MAPLADATKAAFRAYGLQLPTRAPPITRPFPGMRLERRVPPNLLFRPATLLSQHVQTAKVISDRTAMFIDDVCGAVAASWNSWKASASVNGVLINSAIGILPPGGLVGGGAMIGPAIRARMDLGSASAWYHRYAWAISSTVGDAFTAWSTGFTHPAVPFPGGAAIVMPMVPMPPSPNVPVPLAAGASPGDALMSPSALSWGMAARFGAGQHSGELFGSLGRAIGAEFVAWKASTMIAGCMGAGGVGSPAGVVGALGSGGRLAGPPITSREGHYCFAQGDDGVWQGDAAKMGNELQGALDELEDAGSVFEADEPPASVAPQLERLGQLSEEEQEAVLEGVREPKLRDGLSRWCRRTAPPRPEAATAAAR